MARAKGRIGDVVEWATRASERLTWLDRPSYRLEHVMAWGFTLLGSASDGVRNGLNGTYVGHPLHPALTALPVGAWSTAVVLDVADISTRRPPGFREAAQLTVGVGILGSVAASVTGLADWQYTHDEVRRAGLVHGLVNTAALGLCTASWWDRHSGRHGRGRVWSGLGYGLTVASSFLGGNLVYRHQVGVDHSTDELGPAEFVPVLPADQLAEGVPRRAVAGEVGLVLIAHNGAVHALGERCPHLGAPMVDGWLYRDSLVCPWHGSCFDLAAGTATRGPASAPLPTFETRIRDGQARCAGDEECARSPPRRSAHMRVEDARAGDPQAADANEVLAAHHRVLRGLTDQIDGAEAGSAEHRGLIDHLMLELDIHMRIEDALYYPAVAKVSPLVAVAHAEHREVSDRLAAALRRDPRSEKFAVEWAAFTTTLHHHAAEEERDMFPQARLIGQRELTGLGAAMTALQTRLRRSSLTRSRVRIKTAVLRRL